MAKFTRTFVNNNQEMTVTTDSYQEMSDLIGKLAPLGWFPEKNNWSGLVMATPADQKAAAPSINECPHHPGKMRPDRDGKGGMYCWGKLDDDRWCGYSTKPDGSLKRPSRLDQPVQPVLSNNDKIEF